MKSNRVVSAMIMASSLLIGDTYRVEAGETRNYPQRPALGIRTVDIAPGLEDVVGLTTAAGAYVVDAGPSPQKSDDIPIDAIRVEDLIVGIDDQIVSSSQGLREVIGAKKLGDRIKVRVIREGHPKVLGITIRSALPFIYLPTETCPFPTAGALVGLEIPAILLSGYPIVGISPTDLSGGCRSLVQACMPLQLVKQTEKRTVIDINGFNHEIRGNWQAHTHLSREECLEEKSKLESLRKPR
jgi:hypothetical protein